jgi:hypothetical protein
VFALTCWHVVAKDLELEQVAFRARRQARHQIQRTQGAATQALVLMPWISLRKVLVTGESTGLTRDLLMTLAWVINIAVARLPAKHALSGADPAAFARLTKQSTYTRRCGGWLVRASARARFSLKSVA